MKKLFIRFLFLFGIVTLFSTVSVSSVYAQNLENIQDLQVDNLTDDQILQIYQQIQVQGLSIQELGNVARARGMPASEVAKLTSRLNRVQSSGAGRGAGDTAPVASRTGEQGQRLYQDQPVGEVRDELLVSELERLVQERNERDLMVALEEAINEGFPVFGANMFTGASSSFAPSLNIPTPEDYTFGTDDEIVINIWGAAERDYSLIVDPEGNIRIPNLGPIRVSGLTVTEARERILTNLERIYSGLNASDLESGNTFADISLGSIRSINVSVIGEIKQPGSYTVSALAKVFNMLYAAGGPNRSGSWRSIEVIRNNEVIATFDLYDLLVHASVENNIRLRDQDVVRVSPYINRVRLSGQVKRPGIFEMKEGETLGDLIEFTGGFAEEAYTERIVLERRTNVQRSVSDVNWPEGQDLSLQNGDRIEIGEIINRYENRVTIEGAVYREGVFELTDDMTLLDLIEKAEGISEDAYLERGIIIRARDNLRLESIPFSVEDVLNGDRDIPLRRDDIVRISSLFDLQEEFTIAVNGAVNDTGTFDYLEGMTLEDAIFLAEGLRDEAAAYRVEVARRVIDDEIREKVNQVAEVYQFEIAENFQFTGDGSEFKLQPFDQIFVRTKPNYQRQLTVRIEGEVQFPGEYVLERRDARLTDLIEQAGGLSGYAYPKGASMQRILDISTGEDEDTTEILNALPTIDGMGLGELNLDDVNFGRNAEEDTITTAVGIRLEEALQNPGGPNDLILEENDVIRIPKQYQTIRVEGGVLSPVSMRFVPGRGLQSYINAAGGTTDRGQRHRAYIVYPNGEVDRTRRFLFIKSNPEVEPGATIIVPEKPPGAERSPEQTVALSSAILSATLVLINILDRIER